MTTLEVERLRAFVREKCVVYNGFTMRGDEYECLPCGRLADSADKIEHAPDCLWVACAIDPKLSER